MQQIIFASARTQDCVASAAASAKFKERRFSSGDLTARARTSVGTNVFYNVAVKPTQRRTL